MRERIYQNELAYRASDNLPFVDNMMVKDVCRTIKRQISTEGSKETSVIYPITMSLQEQDMVRRRLGTALSKKITFDPIRLKEGMGTAILITKKKRR